MTFSLRRCTLLLLTLIGVFVAPTADAQSTAAVAARRVALIQRLDSLTRSWRASAPAVGLTVAIVHGDDTLLLEGVGERNRELHLPATTGTVYRVGAITQQFTAAAILQLAERRRLSLNDPIARFLPEYPQWRAVTVRQLLNHTSGIHSYTDKPAWTPTWSQDRSPAQLAALVTGDTVDFASGKQWRYSNTNYLLLGMILDRLTGQRYPTYMRSHFFIPLGMRSASYCPSSTGDTAYAAGYSLDNGTIAPARYISMTHPYSAGALCMDVPDLLRWQAALTSGRVVTPASYRMMSSADSLADGSSTNYGFGLAVGRLGVHRVVRQNGSAPGFSAEQLWLPDDSLSVVVFTNTAGTAPESLSNNLVIMALGLPVSVVKAATPALQQLSSADRARYVGVYDIRLTNGRILPVHVTDEGGALIMQAEGPGQNKFPMLYYGNDVFGLAVDPSLRLTIFFERGKATRARLVQRGATSEGPRRP